MRSLFYAVMALLVLQLFFPVLLGQLETTLLEALNVLESVFSNLPTEGITFSA